MKRSMFVCAALAVVAMASFTAISDDTSLVCHVTKNVIDAENNYWGAPSGPLDTSDDRATGGRRPHGRAKGVPVTPHRELARRHVVVRPAVEPEQLRVVVNSREGVRVDACRMGQHAFQHPAHVKAVRVPLVVVDVAAGDGGARQVIRQRLLAQAQAGEPVRVQLDHRGIIDPLEQVRAIGFVAQIVTCSRYSGTWSFHPSSFSIRAQSACCADGSPWTT